ncbi:hypothetical protein HALLA_01545 (plasmid) [Halostagnicola larsenii XH-48]|uniref:Uncharacterized protein n=1 Tax=Halostagnicola larsenii XH-48 TaxID=797299 RepID=W0JTS5_9EURY|nr:hypothetical protein HALLA_01545 [Halostagnicola larsenii XH-48]
MTLVDLLSECYAAEFDEAWERERTATPVRMFAIRLHATGCSLRETQAILRFIGVERSHQAIWNWVHRLADSVPDPPTAKPSQVAIDETAVKINGDWSWVYAAIESDRVHTHSHAFSCSALRQRSEEFSMNVNGDHPAECRQLYSTTGVR